MDKYRLTEEEVKASLFKVQPDGFNWIDMTDSEKTKYKTVVQATLAKIKKGGKLYREVKG